ncbi:MAG: hypothetical protein LBU37_00630, partial [Tannerellaceae bacterium]|nr:hypothetical protein [Tannerellaceae bacterium]
IENGYVSFLIVLRDIHYLVFMEPLTRFCYWRLFSIDMYALTGKRHFLPGYLALFFWRTYDKYGGLGTLQ